MKLRLAVLAALCLAGAAHASPWAEVGDRQFRQDIEMLKGAGVIRGPINSWPLPWAQIDNGIQAWGDKPLPPHLEAAIKRVEALSDLAQRRTVYEIKLNGTNKPQLVRDFGGGARTDADVSVSASHDLGPVFIKYGVGYRNGQRGKDYHFEPSYAAVQLGNWALYGGYVEQWWGPGHDGALLFSNSARPFPKVGIKRLSPDPIDFPVLRWLGPIRFDMFGGVLTENRDYPDTGIIGIRVGFEPVRGLEISFNRALQLCGKGRSIKCTPKLIAKALIGVGNADNTGTPQEPGNQLAGYDVSFTRNIGKTTVQVYGEAEAEDEDNFIIEQYARQVGLSLSGALGKKGASWNANAEYTDTLGSKLFGGQKYPGSLYNNFIYIDGFTYKRKSLGYSLDGDTRTFTLAGAVNDTRNRRWYGSVRIIDLDLRNALNPGGLPANRISSNRETIQVATGGVEWPTKYGDLKVEGRLQNDGPNTPGTSKLYPAIEVGFRSRF